MGWNYKLKGKIYEKYKNEAECAKALGWSRQKLNKITTGKKIPDLIEVDELAKVFDTTIDEMAYIFLESLSPNEQRKIV